jgi:WD40 repeat protein
MSETAAPAIAERVRSIAAGATVVGAHFLGQTAVFVLGEEALLFAAADGSEQQRVALHAGAILASASDGKRIFTAGDDGTIVAADADRSTSPIAADVSKRWIDHLALGPDGALAWSAGRQIFVRIGTGEPRQLELPSTVGGIAFAPKGLRLAVTHYNGVTLWFPNAREARPERLEWKGSHLAVTFSRDGRFLITAMQEPTLHGWRLADGNSMSMSGYAAKVRSWSWSHDGKTLATSGASELVLWPFQGKDGPMGKTPRVLARARPPISAVACNPREDIAAVGCEDGMVRLVHLAEGAALLVRRGGDAPVSALAWNGAGTVLAFGTEDGQAGIVALA